MVKQRYGTAPYKKEPVKSMTNIQISQMIENINYISFVT